MAIEDACVFDEWASYTIHTSKSKELNLSVIVRKTYILSPILGRHPA